MTNNFGLEHLLSGSFTVPYLCENSSRKGIEIDPHRDTNCVFCEVIKTRRPRSDIDASMIKKPAVSEFQDSLDFLSFKKYLKSDFLAAK